MNTHPPLDTFESALLSELRREVGARGAVPHRRSRRLAALVAVGTAAATAAVGGLVLRPDPAFAVDREGDGDVTVTITRWDDAAGLEAALRAEGVEAEVEYDASAPETSPVAPPPGEVDQARPRDDRGVEAVPGCALGLRLEQTADGVRFTIPARTVASDTVLHLVTAGGIEDGEVGSLVTWWEGDLC